MPASVRDDPPGVWCMFSDGSTAQFDLGGLPCPMLVLDLLAGLAELVHPHGSIDAAETATQYVQAFRQMARRLSASFMPSGTKMSVPVGAASSSTKR